MSELTQERLKEILHYNPDTGIFTWKSRPLSHFKTKRAYGVWNTRFSGKEAGTTMQIRYTCICVDYMHHLAHRMAHLYMTGGWPDEQIDHINQDRGDNRWCNLRAVTAQENRMNQKMPCTNTSGHVGVRWDKGNEKWHAQIKHNGKAENLGRFDNIDFAIAARKEAEIKYGFHTNHGGIKL